MRLSTKISLQRGTACCKMVCMKRLALALLAAALLLTLAGCGAKNGHVAMYESGGAGADSAYQSKPAAAYESKNDIADNDSYHETSELTAEQTSEKLVYTGSLTIQTLEYENSVRALKDLIRAKNGIIASEEEYDNDDFDIGEDE